VTTSLPYAEAIQGKIDKEGVRFNTIMPITGPNGRTVDAIAAWIYDANKDKNTVETSPRLLTIFVPGDNNAF
jgi:hypothetical protein